VTVSFRPLVPCPGAYDGRPCRDDALIDGQQTKRCHNCEKIAQRQKGPA
jgi:hypothetical protein